MSRPVIVLHSRRLVFIHCQKTAGSSTTEALRELAQPHDIVVSGGPSQNNEWPLRMMGPRQFASWARHRRRPRYGHHVSARFVRDVIGPEAWSEYFSFTVERNPWDKAVSWYFWRTRDDADPPSFSEFIRANRSILSAVDLYTIDGEIAVDRVVQFDDLHDGLQQVWADNELPALSLPHILGGTRPRSARDYRSMYDDDDAAFVGEVCRREIELFGYQF